MTTDIKLPPEHNFSQNLLDISTDKALPPEHFRSSSSSPSHTKILWVFEGGKMVRKPFSYIPRYYVIFDAMLREVAHNQQMNEKMDLVKVDIGVDNMISVSYNGAGDPLEVVFSMETGEPVVTRLASEKLSRLKFQPDTRLEDDMVSLMQTCVVNLACCLGKAVKVEFNGAQIPMKSFLDYVNLYLQSASPRLRTRSWGELTDMASSSELGEESIGYMDYLTNKECWIAIADLQRSIPSMVDGFNPGQRKILLRSLKYKFTDDTGVSDLAWHVYKPARSAYPPDVVSNTVIRMAQNFVGTNNINLLQPNGEFGTRREGGKDHGDYSDTFTCLSPITRFVFPKDDDILLGQSIEVEPTWYVPVIPTVLVNGSDGGGYDRSTSLSTFIPNYNPRDIVTNLQCLMDGRGMVQMHPWYRRFDGKIERTQHGIYTVSGVAYLVNETLWITELPVWSWVEEYELFLQSMKSENKVVKDYTVYYGSAVVLLQVILSKDMKAASKKQILEIFDLTKTIKTDNMHLFDEHGAIKKYDNPEEILKEFYEIRMDAYKKRQSLHVENLEFEIQKLDNKIRFVESVIGGQIIFFMRNLKELCVELWQQKFDPFPRTPQSGESSKHFKYDDTFELPGKEVVRASDYEYLLNLGEVCFSGDVQELVNERQKLNNELEALKAANAKLLWQKDLDALLKELDVEDRIDSKAKNQIKMRQHNVMMKEAGAEFMEAMETYNIYEVAKHEGLGKAPGKKIMTAYGDEPKFENPILKFRKLN